MSLQIKETQCAFRRVKRYISDRCHRENVEGYVIDHKENGFRSKAIVYHEDGLVRALGLSQTLPSSWSITIFGMTGLITIDQFVVHVLPNLLKNASFEHDLKPDVSWISKGKMLYPDAFHYPRLFLDNDVYTRDLPAFSETLEWHPGQDAVDFRVAIAKHGVLPLRLSIREVEDQDLIKVDKLSLLANRFNVSFDGVKPIHIADNIYVAIDDLTICANLKQDLSNEVLLVQGLLFDKREIGNDSYILRFLEKVTITGWKAEDNKFDRNGLIRTWISCSSTNVSRHIGRISRANEYEAKKNGTFFDASPFGNTSVASRINWDSFQKLFLPFLYAGRDTPGETLIKVYEFKNKTVAKGWRGGSTNVRQELDRNAQNIMNAPAHHRQQLEGVRESNEVVTEEHGCVPDEIVGNRTVPSHVIVDDDYLPDTQIIAVRRVDNERAVKELEVRSNERIALATISRDEKAREIEKEEKAREAAKEEVLAIEATKQRDATKEEILAIEATKQRDATKEENLAIEATKQRDATKQEVLAKEQTAQKQIELELARLNHTSTPRRPPTPPQQPRRKVIRSHAPVQIRPRAAANAICRLEDYNSTMLVQYVAMAFPEHETIWESQIWDHFRRDQVNPFLGLLPDNLKEQRTWLRAQLRQLVSENRLHQSTYMGKASFSLQ